MASPRLNQKNSPKRYLPQRAEQLWGYAFLAPTLIGLMVLNIIPIFQTIYKTFFKTGDFGKGNLFVGLSNYKQLIADQSVWQALRNTLLYTVLEVPVSIAIGLVLAVFLNQKIRFKTGYRIIYFTPMVAAPAAVALVWKWLYSTDFGLINHLLGVIRLPAVHWLTNPNLAIYSIAVVGIWSCIGYNMILFLAGLQEVPKDYYEAAEIDGASAVRQFFSITVPMLSPSIFFVATTRTIAAMQVFDLIFMMIDKSNPVMPKTQSLVYLFYKHTFEQYNQGYGATIVVLLLVIILCLTVVQQQIGKKVIYYN